MHVTILWQRLRQLPGSVAGFTAVAALWLLSALSGLRALDDVYYDFVIGMMGQPASADHSVVLVESRPDERRDWRLISERLLTAGANQVVFLAPLRDDDLHALAQGPADRLLFGRAPTDGSDGRGARAPAAMPDGLAQPLRSALLALPASENGAQRRQFSDYRVGPQTLPGIEKMAAQSAGQAAPPAVFGINFHRGWMLPRVSAERIEREAPLPELVQGRTAVVGYAASPYLAQFDAPGMPDGRRLTQLELHGLALDTLLQGKAVSELGPLGLALALLLGGTTLVLAFQPLRLFSAFWVSMALIASGVPLAWLSLRAFDAWPPVMELALLTALIFALVYRAKARSEDRHLRALFAETSAKLQNRLLPAGFAESDEHWIYVTNLVDQLLQLNRTIFLERVPGDHRVREIRALRSAIGDIDELRRDYTRAPYTLAMEERGVIEIDIARRPFLKVQHDGERQFLAPLMFGGDVLGFWAFGLHTEAIGDFARFRILVDNTAQQIGQLLYQRQIWLAQRQTEGQAWRRYLSDDAIGLYHRLSQAIVGLERRVSSFEHLFDGLSTAAILFDLFGRVVLVNERMSALLSGAGIAAFEMTATDLITRLSGRDADAVRQTVQALLSSETPSIMPAHLPGQQPGEKSGHFVLSIRSLAQEPDASGESVPFNSHGLLLELIDVGDIHRQYGIKSELVSYLNHQIGNQLATVLGAVQLLGSNPAMLTEMNPLIDTQCRKAAATLTRTQELLARDIEADFGGSYPIDPRDTVTRSVEQLQQRAAERSIAFDLRMPATPLLVYANPSGVEGMLTALLSFLLDDAVEGSRIAVVLTDHGNSALLALGNTGFGMPQAQLDASLDEHRGLPDEAFDRLRKALKNIADWGGTAQVRTDLGEGYAISVNLRTFQ